MPRPEPVAARLPEVRAPAGTTEDGWLDGDLLRPGATPSSDAHIERPAPTDPPPVEPAATVEAAPESPAGDDVAMAPPPATGPATTPAPIGADPLGQEGVSGGRVALWQEVARCDFANPADLDRFTTSGAGFSAGNGKLAVDLIDGHETIAMKQEIPGDVQVSFDFTPTEGTNGDVTVVFGASAKPGQREQGWAGFEAKFGGPGLGQSRIKTDGGRTNLERAATPALAAGRTYHLAVEHVGTTIRMTVDGKVVLETDRAGVGENGGTVGLMLWKLKAGISNFVIAKPGAPRGRT